MKKNIILSFILILLICFCIFYPRDSTKEILSKKDEESDDNFNNLPNENTSSYSGENINNSGDTKEFDVVVSENNLTFTDENGNMIVYIFNEDRLENVLLVINASSENEALILKDFYSKQIDEGIFERVISEGNVVSIRYNMSLFEEYKDYTKDEIQNLILERSNFYDLEKEN